MSESREQSLIRLAAASADCPLWRNNSGAYKDIYGRMIRYGLGNDSKKINEVWKSSDLIGPTPVLILPHHVGRTLGVFTAIEVKHSGWKFNSKDEHEKAQLNFLNDVISYGGFGAFCRSKDEYLEFLNVWRG